MVTVDPDVRLLPAAGFCWNTLPGVASAGPATVMTWTSKPWFRRIDTAVALGSPTTFCTWDPPPDTKMVTWPPWASNVPAAGSCRTTLPWGAVELLSVLVITWNLLRFCCAVACDSPTTLGTLIFFGPADTRSVTTLCGATLAPNWGSVLITMPGFTDDDATLTALGVSPALVTAFSA